jgi:glycosyltransferase involved in cell wall biosynthesis
VISANKAGKYDLRPLAKMLFILRRKKIDIIQPFLTPATFFGLLPALLNRTPVKIITERGGGRLGNNLGYKFYLKMEDFFTRFADWVVPNSEAGKSFLIDRGINPARIKVIYNGLNLGRLTADRTRVNQIRSQMGLPPDGIVVGITANLSPVKDHATFLQGARMIHDAMPQTRFAILGDGPLRLDLENMARELGMDSCVTFFGHQRDVAAYLASYDIFCLCSKFSEGCSNATLEAMVLGKPVVVSDVGGNREIVEHEKTGLLIPLGSPEALAKSVLTCIRQPDRAREMGQRARETVLARFSHARMVHNYEQLYEQAMRLKGLLRI